MQKGNDENNGLRGAVALAHFFLRQYLRPGDRAVDATCGNGHDTLLLAGLVGPTGKVWGFDIQPEALGATGARLAAAGCRGWVELIGAGHERLADYVQEPVRTVVFNLGYLPGGDKGVITRPPSTLAALDRSLQLLTPGGIVVIVIYPGHPGGAEEAAAVEGWGARLPVEKYSVWCSRQLNRAATAPYLLVIEKLA
jgi:SAM-dependent methyltransferase